MFANGLCQSHLIDLTAKMMIVSWEMQLRNFLFNTYKYFNMKVRQQITMSWRVIPRIYTLFSKVCSQFWCTNWFNIYTAFQNCLSFQINPGFILSKFLEVERSSLWLQLPLTPWGYWKIMLCPMRGAKKDISSWIKQNWLLISETNLPNNRQLLEILCRHWKV